MTRFSRLPLVTALALVVAFLALRPSEPKQATRPLQAEPVSHPTSREPARPRAGRSVPVRGHVYDQGGAPLARVLVRVHSLDARGTDQDVRSDERGAFQAHVSAPGRYRLSTDTYLHHGAEQTVSVAPGDSPVVGLALRRLPAAGSITGHMLSETGTYRFPVRVTLAPNGRLPLAERWVEWVQAEDGEFIGRFSFDDVPWDDYVVRIWPRPDEVCEWTTLEQGARPPATDLEFVCLDAAPVAALTFEPFDATTGAPIEDFELCLGFDHGLLPAHCRRGRNGSRFQGVWLNDRLRWSLEASGYEPAGGDLETWAIDRGAECGLERSFSVPLRPKPASEGDAILRSTPDAGGLRVALRTR